MQVPIPRESGILGMPCGDYKLVAGIGPADQCLNALGDERERHALRVVELPNTGIKSRSDSGALGALETWLCRRKIVDRPNCLFSFSIPFKKLLLKPPAA